MKSLFVATIALSFVVVACTDEPTTPTPNAAGNIALADGRVSYSLHTHAPIFAQPSSRAGQANEDDASGDAWVFVFNAAAPDTTLLEIVKTTDHQSSPTAGQSRRTAILSKRDHPVTLLILANAPAVIYSGISHLPITDAASWGVPLGTSLSTARSLLATPLLDAPSHSSVPYTPNASIPASAEVNVSELSPSTPLGSEATPLLLQRVVAKIIVETAFAVVPGYTHPPFHLRGATLYNSPRNASLFPHHKENSANLTDYVGAPTTEVTGIALADGLTTLLNPIYAYPSAQTDASQQPFVIIQARYGADLQDTFYKLAFHTAGGRRGRVERNAAYSFRITRCDSPGYASLQEAIDHDPSNILYNVAVTDLSSHDVLDNGQYYIGLSNSEYHLYAPDGLTNLEAALLNTGTNPGVGAAPTFGSITSSDPMNLIVHTPTFAHPVIELPVVIDITAGFTTGRLTVQLGNMTTVITVTRMANEYIQQKDELVVNHNYSALNYKVATVETPDEWIKVGLSPNMTLDNGLNAVVTSGGIYIAYNAIRHQGALESRVYIGRSDGGRVKAHFFIEPHP